MFRSGFSKRVHGSVDCKRKQRCEFAHIKKNNMGIVVMVFSVLRLVPERKLQFIIITVHQYTSFEVNIIWKVH